MARSSGESEAPLWGFTWLSALLLLAAAVCFLKIYLPERDKARLLAQTLAEARGRLGRLRARAEGLSGRIVLLEREDRETVLEAIREQLLQAPPGEWLPPAAE